MERTQIPEMIAVFYCPKCSWAEDGRSVNAITCRRCGLAELEVTTVKEDMAAFHLQWCVPCETWHVTGRG